MSIKKKLLAPLALVLSLVMAGCTFGTHFGTVATVGDVKITDGIYLYYQYTAYGEALSAVEDSEKSLFKQKVGDQTASEYIVDRTKTHCASYAAVEQLFAEKGLELTDSDRDYVDAAVAQNWPSGQKVMEKNGVSEATYKLIVENAVKSTKLFNALYGEGGEKAVTDEELLTYTRENYMRIRYFEIPKLDSNSASISKDGVNQMLGYAQQGVTDANGGKDFAQVASDVMAQCLPVGGYTVSEGADYIGATYVSYSEDGTNFPLAYVKAMKDTAVGSYGYYEGAQYIYVFQRVEVDSDPEAYASYKTSLLAAMKQPEYETLVQEKQDSLEVKISEEALKKYTPKKVKYEK
ncbi:hypothetical protein [Neobittarella massiliensis]|uniref:Uncharacterized protein n=2 Tax=Oscillospiraceae TaxID=216572 RepID=A0A8J6INQ1_9FIRM|nr:hypothetical protein [Neobittarella massiliensis]MBC3517124.1 hypothetical protein [Neobittarella massiliensis]SCJ72880.1 Uncharacterised protein [uncultured Anaerotruncus sp.]